MVAWWSVEVLLLRWLSCFLLLSPPFLVVVVGVELIGVVRVVEGRGDGLLLPVLILLLLSLPLLLRRLLVVLVVLGQQLLLLGLVLGLVLVVVLVVGVVLVVVEMI